MHRFLVTCLTTVTVVVTGCATTQLKFTTIRQIKTEPDIYTQQVLENLARTATNPSTMAYFAIIDSGIPQVTDIASLGMYLDFPAQSVVKQLHHPRGGQLGPLTGERDVGANWTLKPVNDPDRLEAMHLLYLWALGRLDPSQAETRQEFMDKYYGGQFRWENFGQGWFRTGRWRDVPDGARYVMHHHGTYCWIIPGSEAELAILSLAMLDIATIIPPTMQVEYAKNGAVTKVTRTLPDKSPLQLLAPGMYGAQALGAEEGASFRNDVKIQPSPGLIFAPR